MIDSEVDNTASSEWKNVLTSGPFTLVYFWIVSFIIWLPVASLMSGAEMTLWLHERFAILILSWWLVCSSLYRHFTHRSLNFNLAIIKSILLLWWWHDHPYTLWSQPRIMLKLVVTVPFVDADWVLLQPVLSVARSVLSINIEISCHQTLYITPFALP